MSWFKKKEKAPSPYKIVWSFGEGKTFDEDYDDLDSARYGVEELYQMWVGEFLQEKELSSHSNDVITDFNARIDSWYVYIAAYVPSEERYQTRLEGEEYSQEEKENIGWHKYSFK